MNHEQSTIYFERAVRHLQENLQYLVDSDKVGERFVKRQSQTINSLIDYQESTKQLIEFYQNEQVANSLAFSSELKRNKTTIESFEAVCIIHGIMDFPCWMSKSNEYLVFEAVNLYKNGMFQLPSRLVQVIDMLPDDKQRSIKSLLNGNSKLEHERFLLKAKSKLEEIENARKERDKEIHKNASQETFDFRGF